MTDDIIGAGLPQEIIGAALPQEIIGAALPRVEGPLKVTGHARYTADHHYPDMLVAVPVCATVAVGSVRHVDCNAARGMPGVHAILTRESIGNIARLPEKSRLKIDEKVPPLQDDEVRYYGQFVALVLADTFEQARDGARAVRVDYAAAAPDVRMAMTPDGEPEVATERGDPEAAYDGAAVQVDETWCTPIETHNPMELHATVARWEGDRLTVHETTQAVVNHRGVLAAMLQVPEERVRVVTTHLGGGFGGKLWPWTHSLLAAQAARVAGRPVKLVVTRQMMFRNVGHRTNTQQRIRLAAGADGRLVSLRHDFIHHDSRAGVSEESCGEATGYLYATPNLRVTAATCRRDLGVNTAMRGPGVVPGMFALESAMNELADRLAMDPLALRLVNDTARDESKDVPFSSRHLRECLELGAERFGWARRDPAIGAMRDGDTILGWGMASATWPGTRTKAQVSLSLHDDGTVRVRSATQDIGTGTYTVLAQMAAHETGVDIARVSVEIGDTDLPPGPTSGGSMATASLVPAVAMAARHAIRQLLDVAGRLEEGGEPRFAGGRVTPGGLAFGEVLRRAGVERVEGQGISKGSAADPRAKEVSIRSFGAHFVEVAWQPAMARLAVRRVVSVIDGGKIVNARTARNQIEGAVQMGVGMALFEETHYDARYGSPVNGNLADYLVVTHADAPAVDVTFLDYPDQALNEYGARGVGEIGLVGVAPAITAAVYHATGKRIRSLPVKIEDLLG
ncbi:xanthine dehydrogenase family protein molybdopterin-binding subunit [Pseudoduganella umbonata]|uniref:Xanthine dehydrogenase YagR molybdenum-binding subunit n=1 Tax=Pseudoduganella umbonata TaxID=864828 RepID=A0A4P8HJH7_9BURK|nr:xanthine dehydrogenase family protein molybdopterin-binding subunit [Pseudoduganella umbonata]MBB3219633.1 xanthine dehydrogenase YagR molybdenum-binding subunit [Pseudoduganella umbonata]QCP09697.1 xanthine dehydrogenase family protein molybdopterin-binding subunit [Pseudoduganella umbonata]